MITQKDYQDMKQRGIKYKCPNGTCGWEAKTTKNIILDDNGTPFCPICGKVMIEVKYHEN
ncbi:MAG TPA: hypothetical protein DCK79_03810 [Candidatus Atribacteria bacterium]|nr:hypothetical protein [Candidatus Atribacteria bacterium]